ncbi:uncharacterized protein IAS62_000099 [Cryptococcus decagattii]|uniref:Uncharacterized protein n=1 Tax=Cryptococcus decagattii TaxID=1859122 RepID=A0ABZ2AMY1_9TREE
MLISRNVRKCITLVSRFHFLALHLQRYSVNSPGCFPILLLISVLFPFPAVNVVTRSIPLVPKTTYMTGSELHPSIISTSTQN